MIRARFDSPWHDYRNVFDDLRNGKLSMAEYDIMVNEDALEADRRRSGLVVAVDALDKRLTDESDDCEVKEDSDRDELEKTCTCDLCNDFAERVTVDAGIKRAPTPKVTITLDDSDEDITHSINLVDDEAVILVRNESSGAY